MPPIGSLLGGKYRVVAKIGSGGMGTVFRAQNTVTGKHVAIKWMHPEFATNSDATARLLREAQTASSLSHPNVVDIYDIDRDVDGQTLFLVMELLEGETLRAYLERNPHPTITEFVALLLPALEGVAAAHDKGVIHRDLKPDNIFLVRAQGSTGLTVKVLDFGVAKFTAAGGLTLTGTGMAIGTPMYMSLEQMRGDNDVDVRGDVYAFGVMLYEAITGQMPYSATTLSELAIKVATTDAVPVKVLRPDVPAPLARLVDWAIARNRELRLPTVRMLIQELEAFARDSGPRKQVTSTAAWLPRLAAAVASPTVPRKLSQIPSLIPLNARLMATNVDAIVLTARARVPANEFDTLVPSRLADARESIAGFLASVFHSAEPLSGQALRFHGVRIRDADSYEYFALLIPAAASAPVDPKLGTRTFAAISAPLEVQLAALPSGSRKVVIVISDFVDWGYGVRKRILKYRNDYDALVVPLYIKEVQRAHRQGALRRLFDERIATFHPNDNLYANVENRNPAQMVGMHRELNRLVSAVAHGSRLIVVDGLPGTGRSSLVARAAYEVDEPFSTLISVDVPHDFDELALRIAELLEVTEAAQLRGTQARMRETLGTMGRVLREQQRSKVLVLEDGDWMVRPLDDPAHKPEQTRACQEFWSLLYHQAEHAKFTVLLTCVRGYPLTQRTIGSWDNPLKNIVHCPVPHLDVSATVKFVRESGLQMNVHFHTRALRLIYRESGGNLDLVRRICSDIVDCKHLDTRAHRLRRITVTRGAAMQSIRRIAGGGRMSDETQRWLSPVERDVVRAVVTRRPRNMHELAQGFPSAQEQQVRQARARLERIGLIQFGARVQLTIPLLERWVKNDFGRNEGQDDARGQRNFAWLATGLVLGSVFYAAAMFFGARPTMTRSTGEGCSYTVMHPTNIVPGRVFAIQVQRTACRVATDATLALTAHEGTSTRIEGNYASIFVMRLGEAGRELKLSIDEGRSDIYGFTLAGSGLGKATIEMGTDWLGVVSTWAGSVMKLLALLSSFAGVLATFFRDLEPIWIRFARKTSKPSSASGQQA